MREKRWLGYINSDEELEVVYVHTENIKRIYARKKFDKEKWANRIYDLYERNVTISVNRSMGYVVCRHKVNHRVGYSFCCPTDKFNEKIGVAIAICRVFNLVIPKEIFKD